MKNTEKLKRYHELFSDDAKAEAFDQLADVFYAGNFGTMSKSDIETLMFHFYIEQILKKGSEAYPAYSDFRISKELGITQSRVSSLKVKKQLKYPHEFDWKKSLADISEKVRYDDGKLKLYIPDINLYYEIKNAVEESGGYVDVTLTPKLLQISPEYFLDLLVMLSEDKSREKLRKCLRDEIRKHSANAEYLEAEPFGKQLKNAGWEIVVSVLEAAISNVGFGTELGAIMTNVSDVLKAAINAQIPKKNK